MQTYDAHYPKNSEDQRVMLVIPTNIFVKEIQEKLGGDNND